jgi:protein SMG7
VSRADLLKYQDFLVPHVRELYSLLAEILTLLLPLALSNKEVVESKYLLPEDVEAVGIKLLSDRKLPLFLSAEIIPGHNPPKCHKSFKPRKKVIGLNYTPHIETVWRIRDIVCCGIYLAGSGKSPLAMMNQNGFDVWTYPEDQNTQQHLDEATMARTLGQLNLGAIKANSDEEEVYSPLGDALASINVADPTHPQARASFHQQTMLPNLVRRPVVNEAAVVGSEHRQHEPQCPPHPSLADTKTNEKNKKPAFDRDLVKDDEMNDMVNKLLDSGDEDDDVRPRSGLVKDDTNYGMNSSDANEIFGRFVTPNAQAPVMSAITAPNAAGGKAIPNLPWSYFQEAPASDGPSAGFSRGNGFDVPRTVEAPPNEATNFTRQMASPSSGSFDQYTTLYTDASAIEQRIRQVQNRDEGQSDTASSPSFDNRQGPIPPQRPSFSNPNVLSSTSGSDYTSGQRNSALDNLRSALMAQYGPNIAQNPRSPGYSYDHQPRRSVQGHRASASGSSRFMERRDSPDSSELMNVFDHSSQRPQRSMNSPRGRRQAADNQQTAIGEPIGPIRYGRGYSGGRVSSGVPSPIGSGYGPSANQDFGQGALSGPFAQQYHSSDYPPYGGGGTSSLAFSNPSSLWAGTAAQPPDPVGTISCNGNYFNGTTPFGRSGDINNREDPTHFRNRLKAMTGKDPVLSYDRAILDSALVDNTNTKPGQQ